VYVMPAPASAWTTLTPWPLLRTVRTALACSAFGGRSAPPERPVKAERPTYHK
jgi:hypothetical protein